MLYCWDFQSKYLAGRTAFLQSGYCERRTATYALGSLDSLFARMRWPMINVYEANRALYSLQSGYLRRFWTFRYGTLMYKPSPNRRYRYKPTPEGGLVRHGYHGHAVYVIQPVTQPHRPVFQEEGPSPMDWLEPNYAG